MSTTAQTLIDQIAEDLLEDSAFSSGLWDVTEIISYINDVQNDFVLRTQILKLVDVIAAVNGQRIYNEHDYTQQTDRIAFANVALDRTTKQSLDRHNIKWRTLSGVPKQYHQDQLLQTKQFEVDRAPNSSMVGSGYTASGLYGTLRQMSGSYTYTATIPGVGQGGIFRYAYGARAYNGVLPHGRPFAGTLRSLLSGGSNFEVMATRFVDDISVTSDLLRVPDFTVMYIRYGVMATMLFKEGEAQDIARAKYCDARYDRGVKLFRRVMGVETQDKVEQGV